MWLFFRLLQTLHLSDSKSPRQRDAPVPLLGSSLNGPLPRGPRDPVTVATVQGPFQPVFLVEFSPRNQGNPVSLVPTEGPSLGTSPALGLRRFSLALFHLLSPGRKHKDGASMLLCQGSKGWPRGGKIQDPNGHHALPRGRRSLPLCFLQSHCSALAQVLLFCSEHPDSVTCDLSPVRSPFAVRLSSDGHLAADPDAALCRH